MPRLKQETEINVASYNANSHFQLYFETYSRVSNVEYLDERSNMRNGLQDTRSRNQTTLFHVPKFPIRLWHDMYRHSIP
jgi:rhamnogalacturonyl hydrolase YesR